MDRTTGPRRRPGLAVASARRRPRRSCRSPSRARAGRPAVACSARTSGAGRLRPCRAAPGWSRRRRGIESASRQPWRSVYHPLHRRVVEVLAEVPRVVDAERAGDSHPRDPFGLDGVDHPHLTRLTVGIAVHTEVALGEPVDVLVGPRLLDGSDAAADLDVVVRVGRILHGQRHTRVAPHIAILLSPARGIHAYHSTIELEPDGIHLRTPVGHERREMREGNLLENLPERCRHRRHRRTSLSGIGESSLQASADGAIPPPLARSPINCEWLPPRWPARGGVRTRYA